MVETWYPVSPGLATVGYLRATVTWKELGKASVCVEGVRDHGREWRKDAKPGCTLTEVGRGEPGTSETETT